LSRLLTGTVAGLLAANSLPAPAAVFPALARALAIRTRLGRDENRVLLTFDDGPHPQGTPAVLEILREHRARAIFFVVGEQVRARPALTAEIAAAGHELALHCDRHRNQLRLAPWQIGADLDRAAASIHDATGHAPGFHRAPYGIYSAAGLLAARARGLEPLLWSQWGRDWRASATAPGIADCATERVSAGDVILLHDADYYSAPGSWRRTAAALPRILEEVRRRGLDI
jgi:peptidoglycan/xylan/chitin deacetylase (PgdA/CDA1 family)